MHEMGTITNDVSSVCLFVMQLHCTKKAERIAVLFGVKPPGAKGTLY